MTVLPGKIPRALGLAGRFCFCLAASLLALAALVPLNGQGSTVVAWGAGTYVSDPPDQNDYGQSIVPAGLTNAVLVAGGWRHSLALKADGTIQGWGDDTFGQTDFPTGSNYRAIACGDLFSLALVSTGAVVAVGDDLYGQTDVPADLTNVVAVDCGFYHSLTLESNGTMSAWGAGEVNDPGDGTITGSPSFPQG